MLTTNTKPIPIRDIAGHLVCNLIQTDDKIQIEIAKKQIITQVDIYKDQKICFKSYQLDGKPVPYEIES